MKKRAGSSLDQQEEQANELSWVIETRRWIANTAPDGGANSDYSRLDRRLKDRSKVLLRKLGESLSRS